MVVFLDHRGVRPHVDVSLASVRCGPGQWENRKCASEQDRKQACRTANLGRQHIVNFLMWLEDLRSINFIE